MKKQIMHQPAQLRMETRRPTVFVVINNVSVLTELYKFLREEFNQRFTILTFKTINDTVTHLDKKPDIVVLDNALENENISKFQELVETNNPQVKVLMLKSHQQIGIALSESLNESVIHLVNTKKPMKKFPSLLYRLAVYPINLLTKEFRVNKFVAIFSLTFITVGIVSFLGYFLFFHNA